MGELPITGYEYALHIYDWQNIYKCCNNVAVPLFTLQQMGNNITIFLYWSLSAKKHIIHCTLVSQSISSYIFINILAIWMRIQEEK
jgi:hypothetical protein